MTNSLLQCSTTTAVYNTMSFIKDWSFIITPVFAAVLAYKYALAKMYKETTVLLKRELYAKQLEAYQALWQLLAFTTTTENKNSVLSFVRKDKIDTYFINIVNAKSYVDTLADIFYVKGFGVFVDNKEIKANLFEYRSQLYGFLLKEKNNKENTIALQNNQMQDRLVQLHESLVILLKEAVVNYPFLESKNNYQYG